jgi:hypothetical protein
MTNWEKFCFKEPCACISLQTCLYDLWNICSGVSADSFLLRYDTVPQGKRIPTFRKKVIPSFSSFHCSKTFSPWRWLHFILSKPRDKVIQEISVMSQKKENVTFSVLEIWWVSDLSCANTKYVLYLELRFPWMAVDFDVYCYIKRIFPNTFISDTSSYFVEL